MASKNPIRSEIGYPVNKNKLRLDNNLEKPVKLSIPADMCNANLIERIDPSA